MKKIIFGFSVFLFLTLFFLSFSSFSYSQTQSQTCKITAPETVKYGTSYEISISAIDGGDIPPVPLTITGEDVALPDENLVLDGNEENKHSLTTELGPGTYKLSAYKFDAAQWHTYLCNSILYVIDNDDSNIPKPTALPTIPLSSNGVGYKFVSPEDPTTIDGYTLSVTIMFDGLVSNTDYEVCFESDPSVCEIGGKKKDRNMDTNGQILIKNICGDGTSAVKQKKGEGECDKNKDYFHEGSTYAVHLFEKGTSSPLISAPFYVKRTYPRVSFSDNVNVSVDTNTNPYKILINDKDINEVSTEDNKYGLIIKNPLDISLSQIMKAGGEKANNFQMVLEGVDNKYKSETCSSLTGSKGEAGMLSTYFNGDPIKHDTSLNYLVPGKYLLKINERINDTTTWRRSDNCQGGFTYYHIPITILFEDDESTGRRILKTYVDIKNIKADPNESENFYSDSEQNKFGSLPCIEGKTADGDIVKLDPTRNRYENIVECTQYATAIGSFGTDPLGFISTLGTWLFRIATISTFALMIYAGILFQLSRGDKEKIGKAREIITAAITGLIFLILSVSILQIIGIDILKIPGFTREEPVASPTPIPTLPPGRPADRGR